MWASIAAAPQIWAAAGGWRRSPTDLGRSKACPTDLGHFCMQPHWVDLSLFLFAHIFTR
jgi:hypothetical protein